MLAGVAGGTGPNYSAADQGVTVAEIYDPTKPVSSRWTQVADQQIWRLYHSIAFVTKNAEVGKDRPLLRQKKGHPLACFQTCRITWLPKGFLELGLRNESCLQVFISGSETTGEFRAQLYTPDYLQKGLPRPVIGGAPASVGYAQNFTFNFSNVTSIERVVFHRLTGATHGNHMDQRQVVLDCSFSSTQGNCASPPNSSIAPPGQYYLFAQSQGVPSVAEYVSVGIAAGAVSPATSPASLPNPNSAAGR